MFPKNKQLIYAFVWLSLLLSNGLLAATAAPGDVERVSVRSDGSQATNNSYWPDMSADGRFVAFQSSELF